MSEPECPAAACRYLPVALLQRLEEIRPGLLCDLRSGVASDRDATHDASREVDATFAEAVRILDLAARA